MSYEIKREKISEEIRKTITPKRQKHIFNVVKEAEKLCQIYGGDREICVTAALLHDIVKEYPVEELDRLIEKYGLPEKYLGEPNLSHGKLAAEVAKDVWEIEDEEILNCISFHTTGRADMSINEKIVFIADAIEEGRDYPGIEELRKAVYNDLDKGCLKSLKDTVSHLKTKGAVYIDEDTLEAKIWLERKVNMNSKDYAVLAAKAIDGKKGEDIQIFDIALKSSIADYMILASASNERLVAAVVDEVEDELAKEGLLVRSIEGKKESGWILMDFGDLIVNVLTLEMREKYNIEKVWADCDTLNWED